MADNKKINPDEVCTICSKKITEACRALACDLCDRWSHQKCEKVKDSTYDAITQCDENEHLAWYCKWCSGAALPIHKKFAALEMRVNQLETDAVTKTEVATMLEEKIKSKADEVKTNIEISLKPTIASVAETEVRGYMKEIQDISRRENNIVIHKLDEGEEEKTPKDQALEVLKICAPELTNQDLQEARRLGEKKPNYARPLLVKLNSNTKETIMKNLRKLKGSRYNISITHDLPPRTRQNRKKLMDDAKAEAGVNQEDFLFKFVGPLGMESVKSIRKKEKPPE